MIAGVIFLATGLIFYGCAKKLPPEAELQAAREALQRAKQAGAEIFEEYKLAEKYLKEAESLVEEKKYDDARTKAIISKEFSELALKKLEEAKREEEGKIRLVEREPEFKETKLPSPFEIKGINPDDVIGTATLGKGYILRQFEKVYFDFDSAAIKEEYKEILKKNAEIARRILDENPKIKLLIEGHCDERGTSEYNIELGWRRANAIKRYLTLLGIPEDRIVVVSFGKEFPEFPCPPPHCYSEEKWSKNRRGVFAITAKD